MALEMEKVQLIRCPYQPTTTSDNYIKVFYNLKLPRSALDLLKTLEFFEKSLIVTDFPDVTLNFEIKKFSKNVIEFYFCCPKHIQISGYGGKFENQVFSKRVHVNKGDDVHSIAIKSNTNHMELEEIIFSNEPIIHRPTLYEVMSDTTYSDVVLFSSTGKEILSHRSLLSKVSNVFAKTFEDAKEIPVQITIKDFDTETIKAALDFCYGKNDLNLESESKIFEFSIKYEIEILKVTCCSYFETNVKTNNVCEIVEIAYLNNFEKLKKKCLEILVKHKKDINSVQLKTLSKDILIDAFCM